MERMKVSILVPVYGVARYIEECAVSLFEQSYADLEYIFVDDCSPDDSVSVLRSVMERYPLRQHQVRIIRHEHNRGLGAARATALEAATGDFVMVADSDDRLPSDAVAILCRRQRQTGADMVEGAFCQLTPQGVTPPFLPYHGAEASLLRLTLLQNVVFHQLWGRLTRRSVYTDNGINSIEGVNMAEDYAVTPRLLFCCRRAWTDEVVYYYRVNGDSTFADNLSRRHIVSFLRANEAVRAFLMRRDTQGRYRVALSIGMMRVFHAALSAGMSYTDAEAICHYHLSGWQRVLCRKPLLPALRLAYLVAKRVYTLIQNLRPGNLHQQ